MLAKNEKAIMETVYSLCGEKKSCLVSPADLLNRTNLSGDTDAAKLDEIIRALQLDGYFDTVYSDMKGEKIYCITLRDKGAAYPREKIQTRRNLTFRLFVTVGFAFLSFILGLILKRIFS